MFYKDHLDNLPCTLLNRFHLHGDIWLDPDIYHIVHCIVYHTFQNHKLKKIYVPDLVEEGGVTEINERQAG